MYSDILPNCYFAFPQCTFTVYVKFDSMDTFKLDLIHGACQPALNGGLVGLFNPTTVGFLTNAPISPDAPRLVLLCFVKKQYQTRGIGFKKPTPRKGAGRSAFLGKTRDFESSVEALVEVGSVFKMGHL